MSLTEVLDGDVALRGVDVAPVEVGHALTVADLVAADDDALGGRLPAQQHRVAE